MRQAAKGEGGALARGGEGPTLLSSKSIWVAGAAILGSLGYSMLGSPKGAAGNWLHSAAPGVATLAGSYLGGYVIGWGARRALKITASVSAVALGGIGLIAYLGLDGSAAQAFVNASSGVLKSLVNRVGVEYEKKKDSDDVKLIVWGRRAED